MINIPKALKLKCCKQKRTDCFWLSCSHLVHMICTTLHGDITIAILGGNYPKTIYNMAPFEFANTVANSIGVQGDECKNCTTCILKKVQMDKPLSPCNTL